VDRADLHFHITVRCILRIEWTRCEDEGK